MKYNSINPISPKFLLDTYKNLRQPDKNRDDEFSPLHDAIMNAISSNLKEHGDHETFCKMWSSSLFPERLTKQILRLVEEYTSSKTYCACTNRKDQFQRENILICKDCEEEIKLK